MSESYLPSDFEGFDESTKRNLANVGNFISKVSEMSLEIHLLLACIGAVVNVFHLLILTRKSMSNNSINLMMIGISVCDIFIMSFCVYDILDTLLQKYDEWFVNPKSFV